MWQKKYLMKGIKLMKFKLTNLGNPSENIILYSNSNELAKILSIYGSLIEEVEKDGKVLTPEQLLAIQNDFEWDYLSPQEAYDLIDMVKLPTDIQYKLSNNGTYLPKELAHKENQENVLLSEYETFGKSIAFRAYSDWKELDSDHMSDHVDGIKLFEIIRQGMLAAFHINNLKLVSEKILYDYKLTPLAEWIDSSLVGLEPRLMGMGPEIAVKKLLTQQKMDVTDIDIFELNEAFAAQSIACIRQLGINDMDKVNPKGGAIALGHPVGASGSRILTTLIYELIENKGNYGIASLCIGGGMGAATLIKNANSNL